MPGKRLRLCSLAILTGILLASCQSAETRVAVTIVPGATQVKVVVATPAPTDLPPKSAAPKVLRLRGDEPSSLDPALTADSSSVDIVEAMTVGLTRQNEVTTLLEPGMASRWEYDAARRTYTFHVRTDVPWVKYDAKSGQVVKVKDDKGKDRMVTAQDFEYGILRTLEPKTASDYAYVLATVITNAATYNSGEITDTAKVGVRAVDDATLAVELDPGACVPCAPNILGLWVAHAQPQWLIEQKKDRWTETGNVQTYGPYTLREWIHDTQIILVKNPFWPGSASAPQPKIDEITIRIMDASAAMAEYEIGNLDAIGVPLPDLDRIKADAKLSKELHIQPMLCTYYYGFKVQVPPTDDRRVRLALSEAIDRKSLVENVLKGGQEPAQWFSRPGLVAAPTLDQFPDLGVKYDPDDARKVLQGYLDEKRIAAGKLDIILMFNTSEGHKKIAEAIVQMWKDKLGISVRLVNQEAKVYLKTIQQPKANLNVFRDGWCQDYPDANNFTKEVFNSHSALNSTNWSSAEFDRITDQAAVETDLAKRVQLYAQAEDLLVKKDAAIAPLYWYTQLTLTKPYITRTYSVVGLLSHWEKWDIQK